jgi:hypothetical protein
MKFAKFCIFAKLKNTVISVSTLPYILVGVRNNQMCSFNTSFSQTARSISIFCVGASGTAADPAKGAVGPVLQDGGQHEEPQLGHVREGSGQQGPGRLYCVAQN